MTKRNRIVEVLVHGMPGSGRNQTDAKADAIARIEIATSDRCDYNPILISCKGQSALVYRQLDGWHYTLLQPERCHEKNDYQEHIYSGSQSETKADAVQRARMHLAQSLWSFADPLAGLPILDQVGRRDYLKMSRWQFCYHAWKDTGKDSNECHNLAGWDKWPDGVTPWEAPREEN